MKGFPVRLLLFALILAPAAASAETLRDQLFPYNTSCYLRYYNDDHLAAHPAQQVAQILVGPEYGSFAETPLQLRVVVNLRGDFQEFRAQAYCEDAGRALNCLMEGDAGAFQLEPGRDGALRLSVAPRGMSFEGAAGFLTLDGQMADDRTFLLPAVPADSCP